MKFKILDVWEYEWVRFLMSNIHILITQLYQIILQIMLDIKERIFLEFNGCLVLTAILHRTEFLMHLIKLYGEVVVKIIYLNIIIFRTLAMKLMIVVLSILVELGQSVEMSQDIIKLSI